MLPPELENIIFEYAISFEIFHLQQCLLELIFAINGSGSCINTLLLGFCLTPHDNSTYSLVCLEYCLETLENILSGSGCVLGILDGDVCNYLSHMNNPDPSFKKLKNYWSLMYYKSFSVLRSVISPLQPLLRRVYYVIKDKPLSDVMTVKIRRKLCSIFALNKMALCRYFSCEVFEESTNRRLTMDLLLNEVPQEP